MNMKYTKEILEKLAPTVNTISDLVRLIRNSDTCSPSSINLVSKKLKEYNIDTSHFIGSAAGGINHGKGNKRRHYSLILIHDESVIKRSKRSTIMYALEAEGSVKYICDICSNPGIHNGKELRLDLDHIDGNWKNNLVTNLRFLCPNCHSQTDTYGFKVNKY